MSQTQDVERTRTCWCGATFSYRIAKGKDRTHCSAKCREALKRKKIAQRPPSTVLRTRVCSQCAKEFHYPIGRGSDKRYCSDSCRTLRRHANAQTKPLCVVPGCRNIRQYASGICNGCYCRLRRTGTLKQRAWKYRSLTTSGYVRVFDSSHPLSINGYVSEHRKVLFDSIGVGPHPCHWCAESVSWLKGANAKGALLPDHLDGDKAHNNLANLVPSCNRCNFARGSLMAWVRQHQDDPVLWAMYLKYKEKVPA